MAILSQSHLLSYRNSDVQRSAYLQGGTSRHRSDTFSQYYREGNEAEFAQAV